MSKVLRISPDGFKVYRKLFGNLSIPKEFVVSKSDPNWPTELHNTALGKLAQKIKINDKKEPNLYHKEDRSELIALGFQFETIGSQFFISASL